MPLPLPCLMLVTDRRLCGGTDGLLAAVRSAVRGGITAVQLREKDLGTEELLRLAGGLKEAIGGKALLIINGPVEVVKDAGADGVHLPEAADYVERPRPDILVGRSVHSVEAALCAEAEGADYVIAGPVYETRSHSGVAPLGLELVEEVRRASRLPVLAIGGVTTQRVNDTVGAGAVGVAVISAILGARSPEGAARELRYSLASAWATVGAVTQ
jgi:thiamine-phosphate pyrophosphorylase